MNINSAKSYKKAINNKKGVYNELSEDLLLVTSFKKPTVSLLITILAISTSTKAFFRKLHENNYFIPLSEKWSRKDFISKVKAEELLTDEELSVVKKDVDNEFVTSIKEKKYIYKFKAINISAKLKNRIKVEEELKEDGNTEQLTFNEDFLNYFNRTIKSGKIKQYISLLIKENKLNTRLTDNIFGEFINLINKNRELTNQEIRVAIFLQNLITIYMPGILFMSKKGDEYKSLAMLRKHEKYIDIKYNGICPNCYKKLRKKSFGIYCSNTENRSCYTKMRIKRSYSLPPFKKIIRCNNCYIATKSYESHKINLNTLNFCSNNCYETYRKRMQRKKQKA